MASVCLALRARREVGRAPRFRSDAERFSQTLVGTSNIDQLKKCNNVANT